jgi:hypothetical protein
MVTGAAGRIEGDHSAASVGLESAGHGLTAGDGISALDVSDADACRFSLRAQTPWFI